MFIFVASLPELRCAFYFQQQLNFKFS